MEFYCFEITKYMDGTETRKAVYTFDTIQEAIANFHSKLGSWMKNDNCASELVMVIDSNGTVHRKELYERTVVTDE